MDLDQLRRALDEAGDRMAVDATGARQAVDARRIRRRRRVRTTAAAAALVAVIAIVASVTSITGSPHTAKTLHIAPSPPTVYTPLPSRPDAALAYDDALGKVVLFGGADPQLTRAYAGTWLWDGHGWSVAHPAVSPPAREGATMAYDPTTKQILLFGGSRRRTGASTLAFDDTWTFDGTTWTEQHPRHRPPWSGGTVMSFDPKSQSVLLLTLPSDHPNIDVAPDSVGLRGPAPFGTWRWTGTDWRELATPAAPLYGTAAIAFHTQPRLTPLPDGAGLLFYSWAVYTGTCPPRPGGGSFCDSQPDPNGTIYSQTWTWDGTRWTEQHPTRAPVEGQIVATPGPSAEPTVFFPGGATWRWTGTDWAETPAHGAAPAQTDGGFAVYDAHDRDVVAYAERGARNLVEDNTWTWNGTWTLRTTAPASG